ncbi:sulfoxide reductase heme-binding subunit YedZ [Tibeticola sediminis]|jgi:sulfoxide reductase heme-binding subunit YedZ|uniref:Protein-methionine-sulfoxide reductase heme-binding subunit MsrQ n=1 Tax=Tibeticola sediminis TaxID=1917811 RepID=A0A3N4VGY6_9BURK|nr:MULTISPECIES: protein-methionine-sulfoxide reductase heme-binding subunit MsrQ [Tibeticola]MCI4441693.1 sulfoxide reductase heme-binding subunit YedZ [Tibeticola sp.]RPE73170.1 sulfoxide reductase heme-binding subunit YedZ [Tibeticola sediminis]
MPRTRARGLLSPWAKVAVFVCAAVPAVWLIGAAATDRLGANPAESLLRGTGDWTLRLLCVTLAISPLRRGLQQPALARFRRMLGLYTFFYAVLHALAWAWLDQGFEWADMVRDIAKRPFILVGFTAFVLLVPLAATSFNRAIRALGARRWQRLHRLVYAVAGLALLHFFWMRAGKNDDAEVAVYAALVALLLAERSLHFFKKNAVLPASTGH